MDSNFLVFSGNAHLKLSESICSHLNKKLGKAFVGKFANGETRVEIQECVRGRDIFLIQSTCYPANESIMEMLIMVDALRRASAKAITAVLPFYGYGRQERKVNLRSPISAKLVADLLEKVGVNRVVTVDLHSDAIQGFFQIPVDHLYARPVFLDYFKNFTVDSKKIVVVSPDAGGTERARAFAKRVGCGLAIVDKRRDGPGVSRVMHVIGEVKGKTALLIDDICDTAGSLTQASEALVEAGANTVYAAVTHGVFSNDAIDKIENSSLKSLLITDSIPPKSEVIAATKITTVSLAELLAKAISLIYSQNSVSDLFS